MKKDKTCQFVCQQKKGNEKDRREILFEENVRVTCPHHVDLVASKLGL